MPLNVTNIELRVEMGVEEHELRYCALEKAKAGGSTKPLPVPDKQRPLRIQRKCPNLGILERIVPRRRENVVASIWHVNANFAIISSGED